MEWNTVERAIKTDTDTRTEQKGVGIVGQNIQLQREQTDFDFIVGQCLVFDENSAC